MQMHAEHNDTIKTSNTVLRKIYLSLHLKWLCVRGSWRPNRTATYCPPLYWPWLRFFPVHLGRSTGGLGAQTLWVLNSSDPQLSDFLSSPGLYNDLTPTLLPASVTTALIQPVHGQGYNILIFLDRMHLLFTQVNFLFWQPGRVGGQYAT